MSSTPVTFDLFLSAFDRAFRLVGSFCSGGDAILPPAPVLPTEIITHIVKFATLATIPSTLVPLDDTSLQPRAAAKPSFDDVRGLSCVSRLVRGEVMAAWFCTLIMRGPGDWEEVIKLGICTHVLEIRALAPALSEATPVDAFMRFPRLHTAFIDSHGDFILHAPRDPFHDPQSIGHYRLVAPRLPKTLRRLWIANAHGPDVRVIQSARIQCPQLEELWIERCTLFSPRLLHPEGNGTFQGRGCGCHFWDNFPNDHDAYFASIGVEDYALSLATELEPLRELEQLHMGLYLTPTEALTAHQNHQEGRIHGPIWGSICQLCITEFGAATSEAEERAAKVLAQSLPKLSIMSWSSFYTVNKAGRSSYKFKRRGAEVICEHQSHDLKGHPANRTSSSNIESSTQ